MLQVKETYVSRGSTVAILLHSNFLTRFPERTILRFQHGDLSKQCGGLLKGQEE